MRNAPSVQYPVGRCRFYASLLAALGLLALAVLLVWWWPFLHAGGESMAVAAGQTGAVPGVLGALLWLAWALFAAFSWRRSPTGVLHWDAHAIQNPDTETTTAGLWRWHSSAYPDGTALQQVSLALDLQSRMLLRLRNNGVVHKTWVWVEEGSDPARWSDLRRALVATRA